MHNINKHYKSQRFKFYLLGLSNDGRTNKWKVTCNRCNKTYEPATTMYSVQTITCPKCQETEVISYNTLEEYENKSN